MESETHFYRFNKNVGVITTIISGKVNEIDEMSDFYNQPTFETNLGAIRKMSVEEFEVLAEDIVNYDNPDHEWKSKIAPPLPFEGWGAWLERRASYGERETDN